MTAVEVNDLRVEVTSTGADIVDGISFAVDAGEILGIIGESGSGKTTVAHALLGHARPGARIVRGTVVIGGEDVLTLGDKQLRARRGKVVSYVPQDPPAALNPSFRIGRQIEELLGFHNAVEPEDARQMRIAAAMEEVSLPSSKEFLTRYPHQLSGGQQQRVMLAMAFMLRPTLVVLDEPTTGLDVTTQAQVLRVALRLCEEHGVAAVYVTHDLAVVARIANQSMVMYSGRMSELGPTSGMFARPAHPYTRRLMQATPDPGERRAMVAVAGMAARPGHRPGGCFFHPRCEYANDDCRSLDPKPVEMGQQHVTWCLRVHELPGDSLVEGNTGPAGVAAGSTPAVLGVASVSARYDQLEVVKDVSFTLHERECLALVGESGSGKTTLARCVIGLHQPTIGEVSYRGTPLETRAAQRVPEVRRRLQYIFQSPYNSLNPRQAVDDIVALPIRFFFKVNRRAARQRAVGLLEQVGLPITVMGCYPDELSGGERQRVAIARALAAEPEVLICDEITSSLDVSVQAAIIELLVRTQAENGLAMLFITHNLALVRNLADRVMVLKDGEMVESGSVDDVLDQPRHDYTRRLLRDTPRLFERALAPPVRAR